MKILGCKINTLIIWGYVTMLPFSLSGGSDENTLSVRGEATVKAPADYVSLVVGSVLQSTDLQRALRENSRKVDFFMHYLEDLGLTEDEYVVQKFLIQPIMNKQKVRPVVGDEITEIYSFEVTNKIYIRTEKVHLLSKLIDMAVKIKMNIIENITFDLKNRYKQIVLSTEKAAARAREKAKMLADLMNFTIHRISSVKLRDEIVKQTSSLKPKEKEADQNDSKLEGGEVSVYTTVDVVYEISSKKMNFKDDDDDSDEE